MPNGKRVSKYMDKIWDNIRNLMHECAYHLINVKRNNDTITKPDGIVSCELFKGFIVS